jgi:hypothetical protein
VQGQPGWATKTTILTRRAFLNNARNIGVFWMRLGMYVALCLVCGFIYYRLGHSWQDSYSASALLFFVVAFLVRPARAMSAAPA